MNADELLNLHETLNTLRDEILTSPDAHASTALGYLIDADWDTLHNASGVVHRLHLWRKYPTVHREHNYLPPTSAPIRVDVFGAARVAS